MQCVIFPANADACDACTRGVPYWPCNTDPPLCPCAKKLQELVTMTTTAANAGQAKGKTAERSTNVDNNQEGGESDDDEMTAALRTSETTTRQSHMKSAKPAPGNASPLPPKEEEAATGEIFAGSTRKKAQSKAPTGYTVNGSPSHRYCQDAVWKADSKDDLEKCKAKCDAETRCNFMSAWKSPTNSWCRLTSFCSHWKLDPDHNITILQKYGDSAKSEDSETPSPTELPFANPQGDETKSTNSKVPCSQPSDTSTSEITSLNASTAAVKQIVEVQFYKGICKPNGVYMANACCRKGTVEIVDLNTCKLAHKALRFTTEFGGQASRSKRPSGCFMNVKTEQVYFNPRNVVGSTMVGEDEVICQKGKTVDVLNDVADEVVPDGLLENDEEERLP